jgi:hypothetical protein
MNSANKDLPNPASPKKRQREEESTILLSPEQRERMAANQLSARITRLARQLPLISQTIGPTWFQALEAEFRKPYFLKLSAHIEAERKKFAVYPSEEEVWSWTTRTPIQDTKVVILGKCRNRVVLPSGNCTQNFLTK